MSMPNDNVNDAKDKFADKANQAFGEAKESAKDKGNEIKSELKNAADCAQDMASKAGKNVSEFAGSVSNTVCSASESVADQIRKKPVQSAAIALAIGIIGTLFYRRSA